MEGTYDINGKCTRCGEYHPCECENIAGDFLSFMTTVAKEVGDKFRADNGRNPTKEEAEYLAKTIQQQARIALAMHR
jgi:hypothetical protein